MTTEASLEFTPESQKLVRSWIGFFQTKSTTQKLTVLLSLILFVTFCIVTDMFCRQMQNRKKQVKNPIYEATELLASKTSST